MKNSRSDILLSVMSAFYKFMSDENVLHNGDIGKLTFFVLVTIVLALTEGASISLIIPILNIQSQAGNLSEVPIIGTFLEPLDYLAPLDLLMMLALILAAIIIIRGILQYLSSRLSLTIPLSLYVRLAKIGYSRIISARVGFIEDQEMGKLNNYLQNQSRRFSAAIKAMIDIFSLSVLMVVYAGVMVSISVEMTVLSFTFVLILGSIIWVVLIRPLHLIGIGLSKSNTKILRLIYDAVQGHRLIHLSSAQEKMKNKFSDAMSEFYDFDKKRQLVAITQSPLVMTTAGIFICSLIFLSAFLAEKGDTSWVASLIVFVLCLYRTLSPVVAINSARASIAGNKHSIEDLREFFQQADMNKQPSGNLEIDSLKGDIVLKSVSFRYDQNGSDVLKDISVSFPHKKLIAIVGPSGAGKTSLIGLLARFYDPSAGQVIVNDVDLKEYEISSWRRCISLVSQHAILFNDSVRENISFGMDNVSQQKISDAANLASAHSFIEDLPEGYDTFIGDKGVRLSGGQQQRLSIAHSLLVNPDLLILDEATSHLDSITEKSIQTAIEKFRNNRTIIVIAHRLSTVKQADKIIVMDGGSIIESGSHSDLVQKNGLYKTMVEHQQFVSEKSES